LPNASAIEDLGERLPVFDQLYRVLINRTRQFPSRRIVTEVHSGRRDGQDPGGDVLPVHHRDRGIPAPRGGIGQPVS
jgi:hypothetical protein